MTAARQDIVIEKGSRFYKKFQAIQFDGSVRNLVGKKIYCNIKESTATDTYLYQLTEANGGIVVLDDALGIFALLIDADDTEIAADFGVFNVMEEDEINPVEEDDRILQGRVEFSKGV